MKITRRKHDSDSTCLITKLKKRSYEQLLNTSVHAIPYFIKSQRIFVQIFWITIFVLSIFVCSFFMYKNLLEYLEYPVVTNINMVYEKNPHFPKITICYFAIRNYFAKYVTHCFLINRCTDIITENDYCVSINSGVNNYGEMVELTRSINPGVSTPYWVIMVNPNFTNTYDVFINSQSEHFSLTKGVKVNVKSQTELVVNREITHRLGKPYSNCIKQLKFTDLGKNTSIARYRNEYDYHQTNCFGICKLEYVFERCNQSEVFQNVSRFYYTDYNYFLRIYSDMVKNCTDSQIIIQDVNIYFQNKGVATICGKMCPIECDSVEYSVKSFYLANYGALRGASSIRVYFETFDYTSITQIPKLRADDLFGSIGGVLGLFLGISLLSLVEIIELLFSLIHIMLDHKY